MHFRDVQGATKKIFKMRFMQAKQRLAARSRNRILTSLILLGVTFWYWSAFNALHVVHLNQIGFMMGSQADTATMQGKTDIRPTMGKITMLYGDTHEGMYARVLEGHERHAALHGYKSIVLREKLLHGLWSKIAFLLSTIMKELQKPVEWRLQWLFWFDCDIVLLNTQIPLDIFLPPHDFRSVSLIVTNDHNGLNSGAFFIRVNEWSVQVLIDILALPGYRPDVKLKYSDQSAMEYVLKQDNHHDQVAFVPQRWFNAYRGPRDKKEELIRGEKVADNTIRHGDLQIHFAGKETKGIKSYIPFWLNVSERGDWEMPLQDTTYAREIDDFWTALRKTPTVP